MPDNVVVVGSSNTDIAIQLQEMPGPGETVLGGNLSIARGGKGANQAVAAVRAGADVTFICRIGADVFGENSITGFVEDGLDVSRIIRDPKVPSGVALIFVDRRGENSIAVAPGSNGGLSRDDIDANRYVISTARVLLMQLEIPLETIESAARIAAEKNIPVILNPAPARRLSDDLLRNVSILTPNETEAEMLTGVHIENEKDAERAAGLLMKKGTNAVIITMGARGAYLFSNMRGKLLPSYDVKAVDTTAAGDVFNGALAAALCTGRDLETAVKFSNAAAAISVTRMGAQPSIPYRKEIEDQIKNGVLKDQGGLRK